MNVKGRQEDGKTGRGEDGWTPYPNLKGLSMNRSGPILESDEPEGFEHEKMIAGDMIFDPVRGRILSGVVRVLFAFDAFGIRETGGREDGKPGG